MKRFVIFGIGMLLNVLLLLAPATMAKTIAAGAPSPCMQRGDSLPRAVLSSAFCVPAHTSLGVRVSQTALEIALC